MRRSNEANDGDAPDDSESEIVIPPARPHGHHGHHGHGHGPEQHRTIIINGTQPEAFKANWISTAKYSLLSFVPSFLFEQFRRYSNIFFLSIALLQQIPDVSPTGRWTTLLPLIIILCVSAIKEIIEDVKRHRADDETNNREVEVLQDGSWHSVKWKDVAVGDFVMVRNDTSFPTDLILFSSSDTQALCYIETANLDGETNLKVRQGLPDTAHLHEPNQLSGLTGRVECELPNRYLYEFAGKLKLGSEEYALRPDHILLRGAKLQNTNWAIGFTIYTGHETKLMKNSTAAPLKRSSVDRNTNTQIIFLFILLLIVALISSLFSILWVDLEKFWYIPQLQHSNKSGKWYKISQFLYSFLTFLILYNNLIPISLTVTLEIVRFIQALFINWDKDMYHAESGTPAMARTSNLNEELGQVRYVFSDKTGTLTRNIMEFKACTVGGIVYPPETLADGRNLLVDNMNKNHPTAEIIRDFLTLLAVCHTVIPDYSTGELVYHAASPDERALVLGAKHLGYEFETRTPRTVVITALGKKLTYEILNVLEFTSTRKRMSVIVRTPEGNLKLLCKGADSVIYERLAGGNAEPIRVKTLEHLDEFAKQGLRTLCVAYVDLSPEKYKQWNERFHRASTSIHHREQKMDDTATLIERDLILLGATAIEDKLQDEVPETIANMLTAGIHVWVLTGDKQETAINIGYSCRLLRQSMELLIINCEDLDATKEVLMGHIHTLSVNNNGILPKENDAAIIIDGKTLHYALRDEVKNNFLRLCCSCRAVICCRASPLQKAEIVMFVTQFTGKITLAIGDGANDVAMIQRAHVGVGISGQEGLQASCASDYAIAQFKFLGRLLFVHGAWNYDRMCKVIFYSYYKNICLYLVELWFAMYSAWSGQIIFERWTIGFYNMFFTCAQPICMGVFDRNCSEEMRLRYPIIYHPTRNPFSKKVFFMWVFNSIMHSMSIYWLTFILYGDGIVWQNGAEGGYLVLGNFVYTYVVIVVSLKSGLETTAWSIFTHLSMWGSILLWILFLLAYSYFYMIMPLGAEIFGLAGMVFSSPVFWAGLVIVPIATLMPDIIAKALDSTFYLTLQERFRQCEVFRKDPKLYLKKNKFDEMECICPSDFSLESVSSNNSSMYSTSTVSSVSTAGTADDEEQGRKPVKAPASPTQQLGSGERPTLPKPPTPVTPPKQDFKKPAPKASDIVYTANVVEIGAPPIGCLNKDMDLVHFDKEYQPYFDSCEPNQNFIYDSNSKPSTSKANKQVTSEKLKRPSKTSHHPSAHPSLVQRRTKLEDSLLSNSENSSEVEERQQELQKILQKWFAQNRQKKTWKV